MSEISNIPYYKLISSCENFVRLETLHDAIDVINNATYKLPITQYYNINNQIHSSSDGQKFDSDDTINSRYSPKYFGLGKGISNVTLVASHIPINAKNIGANEHESHFVFDLLYNNTSEINPDIHSTDTHGTNKVNFITLHAFGHRYAPRYRSFSSKTDKLCGFKELSTYGKMFFKPKKQINKNLIKRHWDSILKIFVSLAMKTTTQSTIIRKLSSYSRKNGIKDALWEFDSIIMSIYMLEYIDSVELRKSVQKALNRGESYHKLKSAVFFLDGGRFKVKTEHEQQIWSECSRLLCSCIIYYNSYILSELIKHKKEDEKIDFSRISPVAWRHVNIHGIYNFSTDINIDIDSIINALINNN